MSKLVWDAIGEKTYETGSSKGVLYKPDESGKYNDGVPWNGLTGVTKSPSGAEPTALYADNVKYLSLLSAEEFKATITAYTYPDEFEECDGSKEIAPGITISQQDRVPFGFSYQTIKGNDVSANNYGYKIHCLYGCKASPSEMAYETVNDSPDAIEMSWEVDCTPVNVDGVEGAKPTATLVIDSTKVKAETLKAIEDILYGTEDTEARLPLPDEILKIYEDNGETTTTL